MSRLGLFWFILPFFMGCSRARELDVESDWKSFREREKVDAHFRIPVEADILRVRMGPYEERDKFNFAPLDLSTREVGYSVEIDFTLPDHRTPVEWLFHIARESGVKNPRVRYLSTSKWERVYLDAPTDEMHTEDIKDRLTVVTGSEPHVTQSVGLAYYPPDSRRLRERQGAFYRCGWIVDE